MTPEKVREVLQIYRDEFEKRGLGKQDYPHDEFVYYAGHILEHAHGMLDKMEGFIQEGRMDKVYRWLGFVQGVLWAKGIYTLTDMMNHNKKD